jgi:hypothetical protein
MTAKIGSADWELHQTPYDSSDIEESKVGDYKCTEQGDFLLFLLFFGANDAAIIPETSWAPPPACRHSVQLSKGPPLVP